MPKYVQNAQYGRVHQGPILPQFVHDYLAYGAQKGDRNDTLFKVSAQYLHAGIAEADIAPQLIARAVADGLSVAEAQKTITSAFGSQKKAPCGHSSQGLQQSRVQNGPFSHPQTGQFRPKKFVPGPSATRPFSLPLPAPIPGGFRHYLQGCFKPGETISISGTIIGPDGKRTPGKGDLGTREDWLAKNAKKSLNKYYPGDGIFIRINPTTGSRDSDVTSHRHGLFEADEDAAGKPIPLEQQYAALVNSHLPLRAVVHSGDRSIHGIVALDAPNRAEYDRRYALALSALEGHWIDGKNKNPSRFSRVPDVTRKIYDDQGNFVREGRQELIAMNLGEPSWEEWEKKWTIDEQSEGVSKYYSPLHVPDYGINYPPQLIEGLLYQGEKITFIGPSKSFKTWTLMDLFVCIANGLPFWGRFPTHKVMCTYLDFESLEASIRHRFEAIARAHGLDPATAFNLIRVSSLKGKQPTTDVRLINPKVQDVLIKILLDLGCGIYGADPMYHLYYGADENSNSEMTELSVALDRICRESHSSFACTHHFAKGNAFMKDPLDRGAGAGALSGRAPGAAIIFTPHREPLCFTVDLIVRDFPVIDSFVVRRKHPLMEIDPNLDPKDLAIPPSIALPKISTVRKEERMIAVMAALRAAEPDGASARRLGAATTIPTNTLRRYLPELVTKGMIYKSPLDDRYHLSPSQAAAWANAPA